MRGDRIMIPVSAVEFVVGGNTIWVQGENGTVLRIQTPLGCKISIQRECENICSHADFQTKGNVTICLAKEDE